MQRGSHARSDEICLGRVSGIFGLHGEARLFLHNRESEQLLGAWKDVVLVSLDGERRPSRIKTRGGAGGRVLACIEGINSREETRALIDWEIVIPESSLPAPAVDEYYHYQLIGLRVEDAAGAALGTLTAIHSTGEVDVWELSGPDGVSFLPARREFIARVDLAGGRVIASEVIRGE